MLQKQINAVCINKKNGIRRPLCKADCEFRSCLFVLMFYMSHCKAQHLTYMVVINGIVNIFAVTAAFDNFVFLKPAQLMTDCRFCNPKCCGNVLHAHLTVSHNVHHFYSCRVTQHFKKAAERIYLMFCRHICQCGIHLIFVLTARTVEFVFH